MLYERTKRKKKGFSFYSYTCWKMSESCNISRLKYCNFSWSPSHSRKFICPKCHNWTHLSHFIYSISPHKYQSSFSRPSRPKLNTMTRPQEDVWNVSSSFFFWALSSHYLTMTDGSLFYSLLFCTIRLLIFSIFQTRNPIWQQLISQDSKGWGMLKSSMILLSSNTYH